MTLGGASLLHPQSAQPSRFISIREGEGGRVGDDVAERAAGREGGNGSAFTKLAFCKLRRPRRASSALNRSLHSSLSSFPPSHSVPDARQAAEAMAVAGDGVPASRVPTLPFLPLFCSLALSGELFPSNNGKRKHKSRLGRGWGVTAGGATEAAKDRAGGKGRDG